MIELNDGIEIPISEEPSKTRREKIIGVLQVEGTLFILLVVFALWVFLYFPTRLEEAVDFSVTNLVEIIPIFFVASLLAGWADAFVERDLVTRLFQKRGRLSGLFIITCLGIITPGPIYSIFPIVWVLREKGIESHYLVAYLTGQTLMGPMRIPLELYYLGSAFFLFHVLVTIALGVLAGVVTSLVHKPLDKSIDAVQIEFNE